MYTREEPKVGDIVSMPMPFLGYRRIELIEKLQYAWRARICDSGREIEVREDEFEMDDE
ncbi:hypothetical protein A3BBH6_06670 [Alistipes onderdonkii subsp. vulgaris]|uniref:hypothetical protein n=1 Tax=Alistipes onderdonkii TaxID=328813 RepID=UPI001164C869|nr:hypothetical protein [Alistipes onderdonkii]BBL00431.1 hypothetical protein A3BBH6_06670 [Alistipes onderdonkii subsp. vulgaris]